MLLRSEPLTRFGVWKGFPVEVGNDEMPDQVGTDEMPDQVECEVRENQSEYMS